MTRRTRSFRANGFSLFAVLSCSLLLCCAERVERDPDAPVAGWTSYGGDPGGQRYSEASEITPANVDRLEVAWTYHHGDVSDGRGDVATGSAFQNTPILFGRSLIFCTPFNRVIALDAETGAELWSFDPEIDLSGRYANQLVCRGVALWRDLAASAGSPCATRVFTATNDARLLAIDAETGRACRDFRGGAGVDLNPDAGEQLWKGEYQVTSPPVVIGDRVVVGSAVADNQRTNAPSGVVRAFDARSGALRWAQDLRPPGFVATPENTSRAGYALGTPNVWAPMSVDPDRGLIFVPTGNPAPDYWRGEGSNHDHYGSSVVALRAESGAVAWSYQTVHRDYWDFDVPAQPLLTEFRRNGETFPALVQATKMGFLFVLDRETGAPLFEVEERPVPQIPVRGERHSPTQPFPTRPPPLVPNELDLEEVWGLTPWDRRACRERIAALDWQGMYTPPTERGSLMYPGNAGGSNWGGIAVEPDARVILANTMNTAWAVRLFPSDHFQAERSAHPGKEVSRQAGTPFGMRRELLLSPLGLPCNPPPWGTLAAIHLDRGEILWQVPLGTVRDIAPIPLPLRMGVPNIGGPVVTAGGVVFIGAAMDDYLRAFDLASGEELWKGRLPAGGQATPMTYRVARGGRQFVVIAAGGHSRAGTRLGDAVVAFAIP